MKKPIFKKKHKIGEVVSVVSHQLKTPLTVTKGYLEVLLLEDLGKLTPKQKEYLKDALENTTRMIGLVKDLLDVSKIEQNKIELKPTPSSLKNITKNKIKEFDLLIRAKNSSISFKSTEKIPLLNIDSVKIEQVIANFISNAIQYIKTKGKINIEIKRKGNNIIFCCEDNGIGIFEKEKPKIFTKFYRSEEAVALTGTGSGLGLFISKAIIKSSGGKIWFKSKQGQGSKFCFSLPVKKYGK